METKRIYLLLALIFIVAVILNSFVLFFKPLHEDAYFSLRYTEKLRDNFLPVFSDDLSYGGRPIEEPFLFYYLIGIGALIHSSLIKIIPILLISSLVIVIFLISSLFISKELSLIPALLTAFIPGMFKINVISPQALAFPILFLLIYSFIKIKDKNFLYLFVILSVLLPLTSFLSIFWIFAIIIFFVIEGIEHKKVSSLEGEALLFSLFVNVLITLFIFRNSFLAYGPLFIWQNIPPSIFAEFFKEFALINTLGNIGIAALFLGAIGFVFSFRKKESIFLASFLITSLALLWLRLLPFDIGLIIFSITLIALSVLTLKFLFSYLKETKFSNYSKHVIIILVAIIILASVTPSIIASLNFKSKLSEESLKALMFLKEEKATVLAPYEYGYAITYSGNKNVADSLFLLAPAPEKRIRDINFVYTSKSETLVLEIAKNYEVKYLIFDKFVKAKYKVEELDYVKDKKCFSRVYEDEETKIYKIKC